MEELHCGWLTKSPPEKKTQRLFPAKWRRRYFVLYVPPSSQILPVRECNALLDYYSNEKRTTKRGSIDLEKCHSIKPNVNSAYHKYIFVMKTVHKDKERDYYLASESKQEMDQWVNILCRVVGLNKEVETFSSPTPDRYKEIPLFSDTLNSPATVVQSEQKEDYFDLKDCTGGRQGNGKEFSSGYINGNDLIQIYQLPKSEGRMHVSSSGSSNITDLTESRAAEDVYNVPRNQTVNEDYKMPRQWTNLCDSTSSERGEDIRSPTPPSPSASSMTFIDAYDVPPPKSHAPSHNVYITSPLDLPLPSKLKKKGSHKKNGFSQNGSSFSTDAFQSSTSRDSNSSSSSSSGDEEDDDDAESLSKFNGVYNLPKKQAFGREVLSSVFEESITEQIIPESVVTQKVQYLHLDFSEGMSGAEAGNSKPASVNKVEYREIDFEKTKALSEVRADRETTKSQ